MPQKIEVSSVNPFTNAKIEVAKVNPFTNAKIEVAKVNPFTGREIAQLPKNENNFYQANSLGSGESGTVYAPNISFDINIGAKPTIVDISAYLQQFINADLYPDLIFAKFTYDDNTSEFYLTERDKSTIVDGVTYIVDASLASNTVKVCTEDNSGPCLNDYKKNGEALDTGAPLLEVPFLQKLDSNKTISKLTISFTSNTTLENNFAKKHFVTIDNSKEQAPQAEAQNDVISYNDLGFKLANNSNSQLMQASILKTEGNVAVPSDFCKIDATKKNNFPLFDFCGDPSNTSKALIEVKDNATNWYYITSDSNDASNDREQHINFPAGVYNIDRKDWESLMLLGTMFIDNANPMSSIRFMFLSHGLDTKIGYHYDATYRYRSDQEKLNQALTPENQQYGLCMALSDPTALNGVPFEDESSGYKPLPKFLFVPTGTVFKGDHCTFVDWDEFKKTYKTEGQLINTPILFSSIQSTFSETVSVVANKNIDIKSLAYVRMASDKWKNEKLAWQICEYGTENCTNNMTLAEDDITGHTFFSLING